MTGCIQLSFSIQMNIKGARGVRNVRGMRGVRGVRGVRGTRGVRNTRDMRQVQGAGGYEAGTRGWRWVQGRCKGARWVQGRYKGCKVSTRQVHGVQGGYEASTRCVMLV